MSAWLGYWAAWVLIVYGIMAGFVLAAFGIVRQSEVMGGLAVLFGVPAAFMAFVAAAFAAELGRPERPLPRKARRQLRDERARITLAAEIKRMEREAGL